MSSLNTVSSDDVIESYRNQLSEAHHKLAVQEAKVVRLMEEIERLTVTGPVPAQPQTTSPDGSAPQGQREFTELRAVEIMPVRK